MGQRELLPAVCLPFQHAVDHRLHQFIRVRHRDGEAPLRPDVASLPDQHLKHREVDRVVRAVQEHSVHCVAWLPVPVDATLALLQAVWIPRQVVMHDRIEVLLQVDAFTQTVGGDEYADRLPGKVLDDFAALLAVPVASGHRSHS